METIRFGPYTAAGDVNGDGRDDVYIGNAFNAAGGLFLQTTDGRFTLTSKEVWEEDKIYEDAGSLFFDADGDGDQDLFVLNGGMEADYKAAGIDWKSRLYLNDGKGNFSKSTDELPVMRNPGGRIAAYDYDGDGDQDLFIGGRVVAGKYPRPLPVMCFKTRARAFHRRDGKSRRRFYPLWHGNRPRMGKCRCRPQPN